MNIFARRLQELWFSVRIDPIHFLARSHKRQLNQGYFGFIRFSFWGFSILVFVFGSCKFALSVPELSDWLRKDKWDVKLGTLTH